MPKHEEEDTTVCTVVMNHEEQYSIWPKHKAIPRGWKAADKEGLKPECLRYMDEVWTHMRPLSLRKRMERQS
jgi:MbtH protein